MSRTLAVPQSVTTRFHGRPEVTVVVPVFNEEAVVALTYERLSDVLQSCCASYEVIFVDDGSSDDTLATVEQLCVAHPAVALVSLSRNFGKEIALTAGLDHASGEAVIVIDADLQDPPECIPLMLEQWRLGYDMVTMRRRRRDGETLFKRMSAWGYYRLLGAISDIRIPAHTGDFRLLSRRAVDALAKLGETQRYMKGLFAWIGYPQIELLYNRDARAAGQTKWNYLKLWRLAVDGITSFSTAPLRIASYVGIVSAAGAFAFGMYVLVKTLVLGEAVNGYPTTILVMLFLGGVQLMAVGILGEYIGRLYIENKRRPAYLVQCHRQAHVPAESVDYAQGRQAR